MRNDPGQGEKNLLLMHYLVTLANEAFFMSLPHMRVNFIITEETLPAKFAQRMDSSVNLVRCESLGTATRDGRQMQW